MSAIDVGLLLLRVLLAAILFAHSTQKSLGWFQGGGVAVMSKAFEGLGLKPGRTMVLLASSAELLAAVLLLSGALFPVGAAAAASTMVVAGITLQHNSGKFWNAAGGGEYPYVLAALGVVLGVSGPGSMAVDTWLVSLMPWYRVVASGVLPGVVIAIVAAASAVIFRSVLQRSRQQG